MGDPLRTHTVSLRVNAEEYAELERRKAATGYREMGAYVRHTILAREPPRAVVPTLNRQAWLMLAQVSEYLAQLTRQLPRDRGLERDEQDTLRVALQEVDTEVRALRLGLLGIGHPRRGRRTANKQVRNGGARS